MSSSLGGILRAVIGADVESAQGVGPSGVGPFVHSFRPVDRYEGVVVLDRDDPTIRKGSEVTYTSADGRLTMPCVVTRRLRLRDGTLKLWVEGEPPTLTV